MSARHTLSLLLLPCALAFSGCQLPGRPKAGPEVPRPQQVLSFTQLYGQNCAGCHGVHGQNGAATDLANPEYEAWIDDTSLHNVIAYGEKGTLMPGFSVHGGGDLTDAQVDVLVRGMRSTWGRPGPLGAGAVPAYQQPPQAGPGNGQAVYTAACARCHGSDAQHPGPSGTILDGSYLALINPQTIRSTIVPGRPDVGQPDWRNLVPGRPLTEAEVTDVSAWLIAQTPAHPGHPYPTPNTQPTTERPGEQQPLAEKR